MQRFRIKGFLDLIGILISTRPFYFTSAGELLKRNNRRMKTNGAFVITLLSAASAICFSLPSQAADQVVTSLLDEHVPGELTLREALNLVSDGDTISIDKKLKGGTIQISPSQGTLHITHNNIAITADGLSDGLRIDGNGVNGRILEFYYQDQCRLINLIFSGTGVSAGTATTVDRCTFTENATEGEGGGLGVRERSVVTNCTFSNNAASQGAGLIGSVDVRVSNCRFINNHAFSSSYEALGGAIAAFDGLNVDHCAFIGNRSDTMGGAIRVRGLRCNINDCTFEDNTAIDGGSALCIGEYFNPTSTAATVSNCRFMHNHFSSTIINSGNLTMDACFILDNDREGIEVQAGRLDLRNSFVQENGSKGIASQSELSISRCQITDNRGTGIYISTHDTQYSQYRNRLFLSEATIARNTQGGIIIWSDDRDFTAEVHQTTISYNTAGSAGGGTGGGVNIIGTGLVMVDNSTISGNATTNGFGNGSGGGISVFNSTTEPITLRLVSCTIANNSANGNGRGGGIAVWPSPFVSVRMDGVLLANNTDARNFAPDVWGHIEHVDYQSRNLVSRMDGSDGWSFGDLTGTIYQPLNPLISELALHGGLTQTHALLTGSPAIGTGNPALSRTISQNGVTRGASVDIGAYQTPGRGGAGSPLRGRVEIRRQP